jgi:hypothetical protein
MTRHTSAAGFDVVGDIHGNLPALEALGRALGYQVDAGWHHPDGRTLLFLGDLIDRGPYSLETARLVQELAGDGRAVCLLGNHEYNLACWHLGLPGWEKPKRSNGPTCADVRQRPDDWEPVLAWFRTLPIAAELDGLRVIHAAWHAPSFRRLGIDPHGRADAEPGLPMPARFALGIRVGSPFEGGGMAPGLSASGRGEPDEPQEVLLKGHEDRVTPPFLDADGAERHEVRVRWWASPDEAVPRDLPVVVGHYWNLPPLPGPDGQVHWAPPAPSGHPELRAWWKAQAPRVPPEGRVPWTSDHLCVDFNGFSRALGDRACVGAVRWPEREVVWASAPVGG